ncbi:MAG: hypothetical protein IT319_15430 [Anaerolineae bacterium]|nr:hypothetical protein [Anaerolineae bacterium]
MSTHNPLSRRSLILGASILIVLVLGLSAVMAQQLVQPDGRINQIAHFGGDALYCMDESDNVTNNSATFAYFLLRDKNGQPLWTLSRDIVEEGLGQIRPGGTAVQLGHGQGSYGPVDLYGNAADDGSPYFIFIGFDEWGKENRILFYACTPVGSPLLPTATVEPTVMPPPT